LTAILRTESLSKSYAKTPVLNWLNLDVSEGSVFAFIGPNGAGKTTTIRILMNMLRPTSGHAEVLGKDSREIGPVDLARIGYVSENQEMPGWMTVDYLMGYLKPFYPTWDDALARRLLDQFRLPRDRALRHFSRGMAMKASLLAALAYRPRLLIMDEPFSGLDPLVREELLEGLAADVRETTVFVSSHDLGEVETFATHVGYLEEGRLWFHKEMATLTARFRQVEVSLGGSTILPDEDRWPATWLRKEISAPRVRFVDSEFHPAQSLKRIGEVFGESSEVSIEKMPLRTIFVTLARQFRRAS
jgi:ABC-2 type transport system ATP-binding protein